MSFHSTQNEETLLSIYWRGKTQYFFLYSTLYSFITFYLIYSRSGEVDNLVAMAIFRKNSERKYLFFHVKRDWPLVY